MKELCCQGFSIQIVKKSKANKSRIVSDFRLLNKRIISDKVAIPDIKETLEQLSDAQVYSLLDFSKAFNQMENTSKAREKPVIAIEYKNYRCLTILFGSTGAAGTFAKDI